MRNILLGLLLAVGMLANAQDKITDVVVYTYEGQNYLSGNLKGTIAELSESITIKNPILKILFGTDTVTGLKEGEGNYKVYSNDELDSFILTGEGGIYGVIFYDKFGVTYNITFIDPSLL